MLSSWVHVWNCSANTVLSLLLNTASRAATGSIYILLLAVCVSSENWSLVIFHFYICTSDNLSLALFHSSNGVCCTQYGDNIPSCTIAAFCDWRYGEQRQISPTVTPSLRQLHLQFSKTQKSVCIPSPPALPPSPQSQSQHRRQSRPESAHFGRLPALKKKKFQSTLK